jgi:hypothetical protein
MDMMLKRRRTNGLKPSGNAAPALKQRFDGYVVEPHKVAAAMVDRAVARVTPASLRRVVKFSHREVR